MADELLKLRSPRELAAAFVKMYRAGLPAPEEIEDEPYQRDSKPVREHKPRNEGARNEAPRESRERTPREHVSREHTPREHAPRSEGPREQRARPHQTGERQHAPTHERGAAPGAMANGVWFRLNVGRERNADPKWLLPEICRQGEVTKKDIGAIRVFEMETLFQIDPAAAPKFTILVAERKKGGVRISPALDQSGESTARPREEKPRENGAREHKPREAAPRSDEAPGGAPPRKPGFHGKKFGDKKFGGKKFGKPGGGYKGKNPRSPKPQA
jgi:ATP-dependent RNA helicase DeaD